MQPPFERSSPTVPNRPRFKNRTAAGESSKALPQELGKWKDGQFLFSSPQAEAEWERKSYRQAVNHETWPKGRVVDPDTKALIDAGLAWPSHAVYQGPDGAHRYFDLGVIEAPAIRAIRMRNFAGKTWDELNATRMPGEDEAQAYHAAQRAEDAAGSGKPSGMSGWSTNSPNAVAAAAGVTKSASVPSIEESARAGGGSGRAAEPAVAHVPRSDALFKPRLPLVGTPDEGPKLAADFTGLPNGGGTIALPRIAPSPSVAPNAVPAVPKLRILEPVLRQGLTVLQSQALQATQPIQDQPVSPVNAAIDEIVDPAFQHATQDLLKDPAYAEPAALASKLGEVVEWNQRFAIDSYLHQPGMETYHSVNAVEIDLIKRALQERVLDILPAERRRQVELQLAEQPLVVKNGPTGVASLIETLTNASKINVYVGGKLAISTEGAAEMRGSPEIQRLNKITREETEAFLKACAGMSNVRHTGGAENEAGEKLTESWIQDVANSRSTGGSRFMDITFEVEVDGQKCAFHINTADVTRTGLLTTAEWEALNSAARITQRNGENWVDVQKMWKERIAKGLIGRLNAFLAIAKPPKGQRSDEDMRKAVQDFLKLLDCADIEAACKDGAVINPGRDSQTLH